MTAPSDGVPTDGVSGSGGNATMSIWSWLYAMVLAGVVPYVSARAARAGAAGMSRVALYANLCASLWVLAAIGFLVVMVDGQTLSDVYVTAAPLGRSPAVFVLWTAAMVAGGLALFALSHALRRRLGRPDEHETLRRLRPTRPAEALWILLAVSPTAGLCEEFLYRGFLLSRIEALVAAVAPGAIARVIAGTAAAALFGLAHLYQGRLGAARAGLVALILTAPVLTLGTVLPAMASHALIDAVGVLWLWPVLDRRPPSVP